MTKLMDRGRPPHIFLVEDNNGDVLLFRRAVSALPTATELTVASSAEDAVKALIQPIPDDVSVLPDLIVTDLNLPGLNGLELLRILKSDLRLKRVPCLVLTSSSASIEIESAYDAYASGYLTKPLSLAEYVPMIAELSAYWFGLMHFTSRVGKRSNGAQAKASL